MNRTIMWVTLALVAILIVVPTLVLAIGGVDTAKKLFKGDIDIVGGTSLLYEIPQLEKFQMDEVMKVVVGRIDPTGTKGYVTVPRVGGGRLEIRMAGAELEEVRTVKSLVGRSGYLEFRILANEKQVTKEQADLLAQQRLTGGVPPASSNFEWVPLQFNSKTQWDRAFDFLFERGRDQNGHAPPREQFLERHDGAKCFYVIHKEATQGTTTETTVVARPGAAAETLSVSGSGASSATAAVPAATPATATENGAQQADIEVLVLRDPPRVTGADFSDTRKSSQDGAPIIQFAMKDFARERLGELTGKHVNDRMAIALDGKVESAPNIMARLTDGGIITFGGSAAERDQVLTVLQSGTLDVNLILLSEQTLGPELGADNIHRGLMASLVSLICVIVFMAVYYLAAGLIADLAVLLNIVIIILVMAGLHGTWSLPGIGGLILTIGMSVDANVLINERIREELRRGSALRLAIDAGYSRALPAIIDGHVTSIITSVILAWFGSPEVKGFAIVLIIGLVCNLLTAIVATRATFEFLMEYGVLRRLYMPIQFFQHTNIPFTKYARVGFWISMVLAAASIILSFSVGESKYAMEFRGGTQVQLEFNDPLKVEDVRTMVARLDDGFVVTFQTPAPLALETVRQKILEFPDGKYKDAVVLGVGNELEKTSFTAQVFKPSEAEAVAAIGKLFGGPTTPVAKKAAELDRGYSNALVQPVEFIGQQTKNVRYNVEVLGSRNKDLSIDSETVKATLYEVFKSYLVKADSTEAKVESHILGTAEVLQMPGAAVKDEKGQPTKNINDDFLKYVDALKAEIVLTGQGATPKEMGARIDSFLRAQDLHLSSIPRELQAGKPDAREPARFDSYTAYVFDPEFQRDKDAAEKEKGKWDNYLRQAVAKTPALVSSAISDRIGDESKQQALLAIFASLACIIVYLWFRFANVTYGLGAVVALIHDVCIALGAVILFSWLGRDIPFIGEMKIDLPMIGAFLTLVGYSVNDTIVVFDRIRENRGKFGELSETVVNNSINQTLSRTILTSFTVFIVVVVLYFFGGVRSTVHGLSFVMTAGVLVGTYSSVAIAAPIVLYLRHGSRRGPTPVGSKPVPPRPVTPPPVQQ